MTFPYPVHYVPGAQALEKRAQLQQENGGFAVILGDDESLERIQENFEFHSKKSPQELIAQALEIDALEWFASQQADMDADAEEWLDVGAASISAPHGAEPPEWPASPPFTRICSNVT